MRLIGYSLSVCIKDIIEGRVQEEQVLKIVANTCCRDQSGWDRLCMNYCRHYWRADPIRAAEVLNRFIQQDQIEQPRLVNSEYFRFIGEGHWEFCS